MFSDVLLTVDFDRTMTAKDSTIPQENLRAVRWFMENGGSFTVNTGRSVPMSEFFRDRVPVNAPLLLYNGSAAYDLERREFDFCHTLPLPVRETVQETMAAFPDLHVEIQSRDAHVALREDQQWEAFCRANNCPCRVAGEGEDPGPFVKLSLYGTLQDTTVAQLYGGTEAEIARMDRAEAWLKERYGDKIDVYRVAKQIIDCHARNTSKGIAARELQARLGKKLLVCVGDEQNDLSMLEMADYAFVPGDSPLAGRFETVCACDDGAVAEVIFKKIPEILKKSLDKRADP